MKLRHVILHGIVVTLIGLAATTRVVTADKAGQGFADVHVHFNWDQKEIIGAEEIVGKLRAAGVEFAVVAATPSELALDLKRAGGDLIVPLFSPYTHELGRNDWYRDERTATLAEAALQSGRYRGIGEVHFMSGFPPSMNNPIFLQLVQLAREYEVPMLIHIDSGNENPILDLCRAYADVKLVFAHAGGNLYPRHIRPVIQQCKNVMIEFSARDPWRFGGLTDEDGHLLPGWRQLVLDYPDRFVTGTDPVWKVTRTQTWDQADDGWSHFEELLAYHQRWIADLPVPVQRKIRLDNARRFFDVR
ncbi:MAG: amidohydrolase [Gammaproteobacteria bacterium]|nr:amidohydrolase [Gammaproteobacteria bacterium]